MAKDDPDVRLLHMRDFARKAIRLTEGKTRAELENDEVLQLAVTHLLDLIGEAASHVSPEVQHHYPEVPWVKIIGTRNRLILCYDYVDYDISWDTLTTNLPKLLTQLERILSQKGS